MRKIDDFFVRFFQEAYNVLWNRFGITKGMLIACIMFVLAVASYITFDLMCSMLVALGSILLARRGLVQHGLQLRSNYTLINMEAEFKRTNLLYVVMRLTVLFIFAVSLGNYHYVIMILWLYTDTCFVQDRETPESKASFSYGV